jgi:hypothetical protein
MKEQHEEKLTLSQAATMLLEECRMVLPGIQGLFGFQLIAVFNAAFDEKLSRTEQIIHLAAIGLVAISVALVMGPAAYHRETTPMAVPERFVPVATRLLLWSMYPLMLGVTLDFYLIGRLILENQMLSLVLSVILLAIYILVWSLLPRVKALQRLISS